MSLWESDRSSERTTGQSSAPIPERQTGGKTSRKTGRWRYRQVKRETGGMERWKERETGGTDGGESDKYIPETESQ